MDCNLEIIDLCQLCSCCNYELPIDGIINGMYIFKTVFNHKSLKIDIQAVDGKVIIPLTLLPINYRLVFTIYDSSGNVVGGNSYETEIIDCETLNCNSQEW